MAGGDGKCDYTQLRNKKCVRKHKHKMKGGLMVMDQKTKCDPH